MLKIYGSMQCKDCVACREEFDRSNILYDFLDISEDLLNLKTFLCIRDTSEIFAQIRGTNVIGIPCIVNLDGSVCLDWYRYVSQDKS